MIAHRPDLPFDCRPARWATLAVAAALLGGCATRAADVAPQATSPAEFVRWSCERLADEQDTVQQRAADVAYAVDARIGHNIVALGMGVTVFWPALLAMRLDGLDAEELARLKGRFEALHAAARQQACPPPGPDMQPVKAAAWPMVPGERLVYEERLQARAAPLEWALQLAALRRDEAEFRTAPLGQVWRQDLQGNVLAAPEGALRWQRLLQRELVLGQVMAGEFERVGDPLLRARVRGQVVAQGPQMVAGRRFDVVVIELFGDAQRGDTSTRLEGALVVDRPSGVLLRLDLYSAIPEFNLQRRLARIEAAEP